jgi:hypothetical protein
VWEGGKPYGTGNKQTKALSWATATNDLQALIDNYKPGTADDYEIWIAKGTYTPDWSTIKPANLPSWTQDPNLSQLPPENWAFVLTEGVKIYGGFNGTEEDEEGKINRDYKKNLTILSGNLGAKGTVLHTLIAAGIDGTPLTAYVEGLSVRGGYNVIGSDTSTCQINGNPIARDHGGIMYVRNARPLFKNVDFDNGRMYYASGIVIQENAQPVLINCTVSRSQSLFRGRALSLLGKDSRLVMIGGSLSLNWDAGGVFRMANGEALFVNTVIKNNHENPVMVNWGTAYFINTSITGNRGTTGSDANLTITTATTPGSDNVRFYNSVVKDNFLQTYGEGVRFYNTIALDIDGNAVTKNGTESLSKDALLVNKGDNNYYPLSNGDWNINSPGYSVIEDAAGNDLNWQSVVLEEIKDALKKDVNGGDRFKGDHIDLGAEEK